MSRSIALISEHASPLGSLGGADSGGQNVYVAQIAKHLARGGDRVDVFTRRDYVELPEIVERNGCRVIHVPAGPPQPIRKEDLLPFMDDFADYMLSFCRRHGKYDCIHANFWMSGLVGLKLQQQLGIPLVVTFHALGRIRRQFQGAADLFPDERFTIEEQVMREAVRIIAECPQDEEDQVTLYGADRAKIRIVPCGFDAAEFWPLDKRACRRQIGVSLTEAVVLQLGRIVERKGIDNVIRAIGRLKHKHDLRARLLIVGGESDEPDRRITPEIGRLQDIAEAEGVAELTTFVGRRGRDLLRFYYNAADVFVTTPWYEPFGITPLESMACGTPVVGSDVGGIKYTVAHGTTGFLVPPRDPDTLADRLFDILSDADRRAELGRQAIRRANNHFTWRKVTHMVSRVYDEAIDECPSKRRSKSNAEGAATAKRTVRLNRRSHSLGRAPAIFLDKDGTVIDDVPYNVDLSRIQLATGAAEGLSRFHEAGYRLIVISNQSGIAHGYFDESALAAVEGRIRELLMQYDMPLDGFYYCPHHPEAKLPGYRLKCGCRKPAPGLILQAAEEHSIDPRESWFIGDILNDVEAGRRAGCRTALIDNGNETHWRLSPERMPDLFVANLAEAASVILSESRPDILPHTGLALGTIGERV